MISFLFTVQLWYVNGVMFDHITSISDVEMQTAEKGS